jgi:acetyl-CoA carboxylase carboxyl transferase subunit alpha
VVRVTEDIRRLRRRFQERGEESQVWDVVQNARHQDRPYTLDYVQRLFGDSYELHGDRTAGDDPAIVAGIATYHGRPVAFVGHQKGRDLAERTHRNFGMARPEGYRKAIRAVELADRLGHPILTFIDTPGAYPGVGAEQAGQAGTIARSILSLARVSVPVICSVIGEGGSGGALAIAVGDMLLMMQYATYSVISPEGCASILWRSAEMAPEAAEALGITANRLKTLGLIDKIVPEPLGGAHRDPSVAAQALKRALGEALKQVQEKKPKELVESRLERLMGYGKFKEAQER